MKATEINLSRFLAQTDTQFVIPVYQRNYDWTKSQCKQLWFDILEAGSTPTLAAHFIGSIVFIHDDVYSSSGIRELTIIDGQQRLTTITLIYLVLYHASDERVKEQIRKRYLINEFDERDGSKLKLRPTENNDRALKYLIDGNDPAEYSEYSGLVHNYEYFSSLLTQENLSIVKTGLDKLMFVEISLERGKDDPQRIFESLNSTGLELSQGDLIRNYILMGLERKKQESIYDDFWSPIEALARDEARGNESLVSSLIRDYLTIRNKTIPKKSAVYSEFKAVFPDGALEETLSEIKQYARYYNKLVNPSNEQDRDIRRQLIYVHNLGISVSYPFLLQVYRDYAEERLSKDSFLRVLKLVQSYVWRRFIVGVPTHALGKVFMKLYEQIRPAAYLQSLERHLMGMTGAQRFPRNNELASHLREKDLYNIKPSNRRYFLERLENFNNKEPVEIENNDKITIEHIFPQNPDREWKNLLDKAEFEEFRDVHLHTAANLTLSGNNGALGNKTFIEKRDMNIDGAEQGYRFSRLWLNRPLRELASWNLAELQRRGDLIEQRFFKVWPIPEVEVPVDSGGEDLNIFDVDDPTGRKLSSVVFFGKQHKVTKAKELMKVALSGLFELSPETFFRTDLHKRLHLKKQPDELRTAIEISPGYFVESALSNRRTFNLIRSALSACSCEEELFVQFEAAEE